MPVYSGLWESLGVQSTTKVVLDNLTSFIQNELAKCLAGNVRTVTQLCNLSVLTNILIHAELDSVQLYCSKCDRDSSRMQI